MELADYLNKETQNLTVKITRLKNTSKIRDLTKSEERTLYNSTMLRNNYHRALSKTGELSGIHKYTKQYK